MRADFRRTVKVPHFFEERKPPAVLVFCEVSSAQPVHHFIDFQ